jgi:hypothetical protein
MKRAIALLASIALLGITEGCAQHPVSPPTYTCPPAGSYADLNGATGSTSTSYTVSNVTSQTCFEAQGYLNGQYGTPSNIVGPILGGATEKVSLSVTCTAGTGQTCTVSWVFQSAPAVVQTAPGIPTMGAPTTSEVVKPALPVSKDVPTATLTAKLEKR